MTKKYYAAAWLALNVAVLPHLASAQESLVQQKELASDGQPTLIRFSVAGRATLSATDGVQVLRQQLRLGANEDLRPVRLETDPLGYRHQKYAQYYKGVKIEHATYTVHSRGNQVESLSGDYEAVPELSVQPALSAEAALTRTLALVGAKKYMWQDAAEEANLKQQSADPTASYRPQGELVLVRDNRQNPEGTGPLVLAWKFDVYATEPVSRAYYYLDAKTGELVLRDDIIKHTAATGTFATAYSGTRSLADETATPGGYRLREYTRGSGIETYNMKKGTTYASAVDFTDADNNWSEYNNAAHDNAASDAHFGAQSTYDYWKNVHGRNSYDGAGAKILSYVHYSSNYENAFWDGTCMTYGDGYTTFKPLTSLDVCGHEIGHAVCERTANLTYAYESGAMNEGLSDIWGACVEKYAADKYALTGKSTWDIGEEIMKAGGALRSMSNPNLYGQPAYYKGNKWDYNQEVHTNSGVLNYWFYLISVGKTGTNEKGAAFTVTGLGLADAAKITFRMESVYMTASSTYANARTYAIQAATDLFGVNSVQTQAVTNAWYAVGIGAAAVYVPLTYCTSQGRSTAYEHINYVQVGNISRTSVGDGGYYDGTASTTSVALGSSQTISFSAGFAQTGYNEYFKIYADWNQDGDFLDSDELLVSNAAVSWAVRTGSFTVPATALTGKTRLRVVMSDNAATTSCGTYNYGETEDYTLTVTAPYCASKGTITAYEYINYVQVGSITRTSGADAGYYDGTASTTNVTAGSRQTISFSAGFVGGAYTEYFTVYADWNQDGDFLDSGETLVSNVGGGSAVRTGSFTVPATATYGKTRLRVVMSDDATTTSCGSYIYGETEDYSLTVTALSYCASQGSSNVYEYLDLVQLGSINRTSGADAGYYNGTATSTSVAAGSSQTISFSAGFVSAPYGEYFTAYADWNHDGDFLDAGETLVSTRNVGAGTTPAAFAGTFSGTFTVPGTALTGNTRLRVVMSDDATTTSCGSYIYGETEDYTLTVTGGAAIAATPPSLAGPPASGEETAILSLYPNPATDRLQLSLSSGAELTTVEVLDVRGAAVPAARYEGNGQLDVAGLAAGLYLLRATDGQHTFVQRFAKQ